MERSLVAERSRSQTEAPMKYALHDKYNIRVFVAFFSLTTNAYLLLKSPLLSDFMNSAQAKGFSSGFDGGINL
jgi:hypothetical protein